MGVRLMNLAAGDSVVGLARNAESLAEGDAEAADEESDQGLSEDLADLTDEADAADLSDPEDGNGREAE
jgi:NAD(P)-dependent dehydrogenase (short-subunit alcohol dehydrogenase family)